MNLAEFIRFHRKKSGLSQKRLAQLSGLGKTTIYDIEHNKKTIQWDTLLKVLKTLNITIAAKSGLISAYTELEI